MPKTKVCTKCGKRKPLGEYHAYKYSKDGLKPRCKACNIADVRAWNAANSARVRERQAAWRDANRDRISATQRHYYATRLRNDPAYRKRIATYGALYRAANRERLRAYYAAHYAANKERISLRIAAWQRRNSEWRNVQKQLRRIGGF